MMKRYISLVVTAVGFAALVSTAHAQQSIEDEAKAQFDAGVALFQEGQFEKAAVAFARAYELRPSYKILYLVGRCQDELEHFAASLDAFTRYLAEAGNEIDQARRDEVRTEVKRLNALVGSVVVQSDTAGSTVFVDDERKGDTPLASPLFVDLGKHTVVIKQGATELHREIVTVAGGQRVVIEVGDAGAATANASPSSAAGTPEDHGATREKPKRVWTWVAAGVGGAAVIGAAITGGVTLSRARDITEDCSGNTCPTSSESDAGSARSLAYTTDALIAVAGVGIAAGVVLFFLEPRLAKGERVEVAPVATPTADGGAVALVGRF
jgi:hypothetical protein